MTDPRAPRLAVVGSGIGGLVLAAEATRAGMACEVIEPDPDAAERAAAFLRKLSAAGPAPAVVGDWGGMGDATLVVEALGDAPELLPDLRRRLAPSVPVAVTSPGLTPGKDDGGAWIALSLAQPAHLRRLAEIRPLADLPAGALAALRDVLRALGRDVVEVACPSPATRLLMRMHAEADAMLMQGAIPHEIDEAMVAFGYDMGLYEAQDWIGLTVAYAERKRGADNLPRSPISDRMVEDGRLGRMIGVGWYRYPGGGGAVIDPIVEDLVREEAWFAGVPPRPFHAPEILDRLHDALSREGSALLAEGAVSDAASVDRLAVEGLGFPRDRGGPMAWAEERHRA